MSGGTIQNHKKTGGPIGGAVYNGGTFTMSGGTIQNNVATNASGKGGAVYNISGTFTMSGGTITGNSAPVGNGVYINNGTFNVSGSALIQPSDTGMNDVYLATGKTVQLIGNLSGGVSGKNLIITPQTYPGGTLESRSRVVTGNSAYLTAANLNRILVTPQQVPPGNAIAWRITGSDARPITDITHRGKLSADEAAITIIEDDDIKFAFIWPTTGSPGLVRQGEYITVTALPKESTSTLVFTGWTLCAELDESTTPLATTTGVELSSLSLPIAIPASATIGSYNLTIILQPPAGGSAANYSVSATITVLPQ